MGAIKKENIYQEETLEIVNRFLNLTYPLPSKLEVDVDFLEKLYVSCKNWVKNTPFGHNSYESRIIFGFLFQEKLFEKYTKNMKENEVFNLDFSKYKKNQEDFELSKENSFSTVKKDDVDLKKDLDQKFESFFPNYKTLPKDIKQSLYSTIFNHNEGVRIIKKCINPDYPETIFFANFIHHFFSPEIDDSKSLINHPFFTADVKEALATGLALNRSVVEYTAKYHLEHGDQSFLRLENKFNLSKKESFKEWIKSFNYNKKS